MVGSTASSEGINIWYRVDTEGWDAQQLENFTGKTTLSLRKALRVESELTHPEHMLKLVVAGSKETEIDLDELRTGWTKQGIAFSFAKLISDYDINQNNPILVKFPGEYHLFRFNYADSLNALKSFKLRFVVQLVSIL
jgi:hypothetical protein